MNSKRAMAQLLKHLTGLGVTHLPKVEVQVRRVAAEAARAAAPAEVPAAAGAATCGEAVCGHRQGRCGAAAATNTGSGGSGRSGWGASSGCVA